MTAQRAEQRTVSREDAGATLVAAYIDGDLEVATLRDALWHQTWPWRPPTGPITADAVEDYRCALDVQLLLALDVLDEALADRARAELGCRLCGPLALCVNCAGHRDDAVAAIGAISAQIVRDVPKRAAAVLTEVGG